jgi:hypothetical protein
MGYHQVSAEARVKNMKESATKTNLVSVLDTGYPGPPAPGSLQRPNFGPGEER